MAVIVGQGISVSPVADAELSHESTSTVQNKVVTDAIASEYSTSKTYSVGDVCTHDGKLYECIVDIPTAEGWTLSHWKVSNLGDNVSNLNRHLSDLGDIAAFKTAILQITQKVAYIDGNGGTYYRDLYNALRKNDITSISAVYSPTSVVVVGDSLDSIKRDLTVTATYVDDTSRVLDSNEYTLIGTLQAGTNTIIVSCVKEATITVQAYGFPSGYTRYDYVRNVNAAGIIDTGLDGVYGAGKYSHLLKFRIGSFPGGSNPIYGIRTTSGGASAKATGRAYWLTRPTGNNIAANYNGDDTGFITHISADEIITSLTEDGSWYINGSLIKSNMSGEWSAPPGTILLYACRQNTTGYDDLGTSGNDIFTLQLKDQDTNTFVAALMACTNDNGVPGFYDVIRGSFHTAANSSDITVGNEGES